MSDAKPPVGSKLTPVQWRRFLKVRAELEKKFQPQVDALKRCARITAADLAIRIGPGRTP